MMMTVMMTMMSDGYDEDPYLYVFHIRFKSPVRPDWRCRGCVVIIIMMTVGDAEDARRWLSSGMITVMMSLEMQRVVIIIIMTVGDAEDARVVIIIIMTVGDAEDAR